MVKYYPDVELIHLRKSIIRHLKHVGHEINGDCLMYARDLTFNKQQNWLAYISQINGMIIEYQINKFLKYLRIMRNCVWS